jgi:dihydrofolate reductase
MLLVGGQTNTSFFRAGLVNEMFVTVEPAIFGRGRDLLDDGALDAKLQLISVEKLNERGTLTLRYLVDTSGDVH